MKNIFKIIVTVLSTILLNQTLHAQAGSLDSSFGDGGLVLQNTYNGGGFSIIMPNNNILVVGEYQGICFDCFNPDGSYNESFGHGGRFSIGLGGKLISSDSKAFALLADGRIACAGKYFPGGGTDIGIIVCFQDGRLDSSFGVNGFSALHIDNLNFCTGLVVQPDGKIVISGDVQKSEYDYHNTFIARYRTDGSLDPDFGDEGIVLTHYANATTTNSLIIRPDGKLVRGSNYDMYDDHSAYMLESFNPDGSIDAGFGDNGTAKFIFGQGQGGGWNNLMYMMALQPDGKIVCTGETGQNDDEVMALCRFNEDGTVDNAFGDDGGKIVPYQNTTVISYDLCFQSDGKILTIAGAYTVPFTGIIIFRYTSDGQLDPSFGENGISSVYCDTADLSANDIHCLSDGKILTTGELSKYGPLIIRTLLARFNNDNVLTTHFKNVKAVENKEGISISWQTLNESNTQSYTIERSGNAQDYRDIANIPAKGQTENSYNYTDKNPLAGDNYYRIRENARNGTVSYSQTLKVNFIQSGVLSLYPNPAKSTVTVKGLDKNSASVIKIMDMQGREISTQHFDKVSTATLNIRSLAQGAYFVQITQGEKVVRLKMVKE